MKKIIFSLVALASFSFATAQEQSADGGFSKGDIFVSGSFGFNSADQGEASASEFGFSPAVGFFVSENIAIGGRLGFTSGTEEEGSAEVKSSSVGFEAFGRYYMTPASKFSLFAELAAGFGTGKVESGNVESKVNSFGINAGLGLNYFLSSNWAIEAGWAGLGYNSAKADAEGAEALNEFGLNVDLTAISFGLIYKF